MTFFLACGMMSIIESPVRVNECVRLSCCSASSLDDRARIQSTLASRADYETVDEVSSVGLHPDSCSDIGGVA
jgi:hypothetical protein